MPSDTASSLSTVQNLFEEYHKENVRYCHWKSNEHLYEGMIGDTDLDVLVDQTQASLASSLLLRHGFVRLRSVPFTTYPAVEDYLGFDRSTGELIHIHLHYQLVLGQKREKGYRLPWEDLVFSRRRMDDSLGVYTIDPTLELLLLLIRYSLKIRLRDLARASLGRTYLDASFHREYRWLTERVEQDQLRSIATDLLSEESANKIETILNDSPDIWNLRQLASASKPVLDTYRRYGKIEALIRGELREARLFFNAMNRRLLSEPRTFRRTLAGGGSLVAFVGSDGSGKSTLRSDTARWLLWKTDVYSEYLGSGDGSASLYRRPLIAIRSILERYRNRSGSNSSSKTGTQTPDQQSSLLLRFGQILWALTLSLEKRKKLRRVWRARNRGLVVLADRFPQNQVLGFNDGPLLSYWAKSSSRIKRRLCEWEAKPYRWAEEHPPDLVIELDVRPEIAIERTDGMTVEQLSERRNAVRSIQYDGSDRVTIDSSQPYEDVRVAVRRAVWDALCESTGRNQPTDSTEEPEPTHR